MSHFACIGMGRESSAIVGIAQKALREGCLVPCERGFYMKLEMGGNAEIWVAVAHGEGDSAGEVMDVNPRVDAPPGVRMRLHSALPDPEERGLGGLFVGWVNPRSGADQGDYPLAFDAPDFAACRIDPARTVAVALVGFAEVVAFQPDDGGKVMLDGLPMGSRSLIPTGMFFAGDRPTPRAEAVLVGKILAHALRHNDVGGGDFWWARIETFGGQMDLVAAPEQLPKLPEAGDLVSARVWLSGRIVDEAAAG